MPWINSPARGCGSEVGSDALGKRTHELRLPLQHSIPAADDYAKLLSDIDATPGTGERIAGPEAKARVYLALAKRLLSPLTMQ